MGQEGRGLHLLLVHHRARGGCSTRLPWLGWLGVVARGHGGER